MEHVFVLNYFAEQPLKYDEAVIITPEVLQNIEIKFSLILKYKENVDYVGVQLDVAYVHEDKQILTYSTLLTIFDTEWLNFLKGNPNEDAIREYALPWFDYAFNFTRGALAVRAKGTKVERLFLPMFDTTASKQFILIDKVSTEKIDK